MLKDQTQLIQKIYMVYAYIGTYKAILRLIIDKYTYVYIQKKRILYKGRVVRLANKRRQMINKTGKISDIVYR